jgi:cobalt/nickel transport system permease protein
MSHIHIPDGVLPLWLVALGWVVAAVIVGIAVRRSSRADLGRRVPLLGAVSALMLVAMSSEVIPIAYHINLTIVAGILLGPELSVVAAAVVVTLLALLGHGGVTVIGLNVTVIATEMVVGGLAFRGLLRMLGRPRASWAAGVATVLTLALTTTMLVGIVWVGGAGAATREHGALDPATLRFGNPLSGGVFTNAIVAPESAPAPVEAPLSVGRFALMVYTLGSLGWVLEALITGGIIGYAARIRPSLVFEGARRAAVSPPPGDEGVSA